METVLFCEREPFCQQVLRKHWPDVPIIDDVHDVTGKEIERLDIGAIDIISAGYPCQPFSHAGKRRGAEDDRHLWPEVKRILEEIRPRWFVGENVAGHVTLGLDDVLSDLESEGYKAITIVLPACAVYASHRRDRVFIVGYTEHNGSSWATVRRGIDTAGNDIEEGADKTGELTGTSGRANNAIVAYACGVRREECNSAAITDQSGLNSRRGNAGNETLADTDSKPRLEAYSTSCSIRSKRNAWNDAGWGDRRHRATQCRRTTQPGMGGSADELSDWLDGSGLNPLDALAGFIDNYPQPALFGQPQYDWEPPRVAIGVKNRAARLKALGNAVDPLQIFPIMYAIKVVDDWLREGEA